jgi:hypothetical protein
VIDDCQPLFLLRCKTFRSFINACEPGFAIPGDEKARNLINIAYDDSCKKLNKIFSNSGWINITTDIWSSRTNESFIGVTATWLNGSWDFQDALLSIEVLPSPHTAENISNSLLNIFEKWNILDKVFVATTDNGRNIKKAINLIPNISHVSCAAHTLHLSVTKSLKSIPKFVKRVNNLILFFSKSPKQSSLLRKAQNQIGMDKTYEILSDVHTRWNSTYLSWNRLKDLRRAIGYLAGSLEFAPDRDTRIDGLYLKEIVLNESEWRFLLFIHYILFSSYTHIYTYISLILMFLII